MRDLQNAPINIAAVGDTSLAVPVAGSKLRIWMIGVYCAVANQVELFDGPQSLTGPMALPAGGSFGVVQGPRPLWVLGTSNALVLRTSGADQVSGFVGYTAPLTESQAADDMPISVEDMRLLLAGLNLGGSSPYPQAQNYSQQTQAVAVASTVPQWKRDLIDEFIIRILSGRGTL